MREKLRITDSEWTRDKVMDGITGFFILLILVVHPLILNNYYSDVLETKYKLYYISMFSMFLLLLISHVFIRKKYRRKNDFLINTGLGNAGLFGKCCYIDHLL